MKKLLLIIITMILSISASVYAASQIFANNISYKDTTVEEALNDLYTKSENTQSVLKFCELKEGTNLEVGSKYECDPGDGVKRIFYILTVRNNDVDLLMDRNITQGTNTKTMSWADAMKYVKNNNLKSLWSNVLDIDLPKAQAIADAVGNTSWQMVDKNYTDFFCVGTGYNASCGSGSGALKDDIQTIRYRWLFNYTRDCAGSGCLSETSLSAPEAVGYWTCDMVANNTDSNFTHRAWLMGRSGNVSNDNIYNSTTYGVRPVITVLKANLTE